jgi:hypothetical protein
MWKVLALSELNWAKGFLESYVRQDERVKPALDKVDKAIQIVEAENTEKVR